MKTTPAPVHLTRTTFEPELARAETDGLPVVIDFWAPWCGPCRSVAPILDQLAVQYAGRVRVAKVNVDQEPELAQAFRIQGIPTLHVVHGRAVVDSAVGFGGRPALDLMFARAARRVAAPDEARDAG